MKRMLVRESPYFCALYANFYLESVLFFQQETNICIKKQKCSFNINLESAALQSTKKVMKSATRFYFFIKKYEYIFFGVKIGWSTVYERGTVGGGRRCYRWHFGKTTLRFSFFIKKYIFL
jgi:hypothetical protein